LTRIPALAYSVAARFWHALEAKIVQGIHFTVILSIKIIITLT